ncbi:MAG: FAD-dependent oxidoreductase, partial [Nitrospirae bacterium]|nr:FAD-dependent oxidoreductase [Nitrospirota bacterium]
MKKVIILGAGFAGLHIFYTLRHLIGKKIEVTVVNPTDYSLLKPSLPDVALAGLEVKHTHTPIKKSLESKGATFVEDEAVKIDAKEQIVHLCKGDTLSYDTLFIAMGVVKDYDAIEGFKEYGYSVCDDVQAQRLWERLESFEGGDIVTGSAKSVFGTRVDAPKLSAPCEGPIGEIMFMAEHYLKTEKHLSSEDYLINVFSPSEVFFEDVGEKPHIMIGKLMEEKSIKLHTNKILKKIEKQHIFFEDGTKLPCDLAIVIPPYKAPKVIIDSELGDEKGFVPTDTSMKHLDYKNIYAAGDINALTQPKLGHIAIIQGEIAAKDFMKSLGEDIEIPAYEPEVFCIMNMGGSEAVMINDTTLYGGKRSIALHSPVAKAMKWSFDNYLYFNRGHMPPEWALKLT